jgi:cyclopropane-fatty-acyl-phospholipid synthase
MTTFDRAHVAQPSDGEIDTWLRLLVRIASRIRVGRLQLVLPGGGGLVFRGDEAEDLSATLIVNRPRLAQRLLAGGTTGFAEAFIDGDGDSPDLPALLKLAHANEASLAGALRGFAVVRWLDRLRHLARPNTRRGSRRNIADHYDLGNAFYRLWLDAGMTYSSGLFDRPDQSLDEAQDNKFRRLAQTIGLRPGLTVLEIGCGWGSFAEVAARDFGCRVTAVTLSREQEDYARRRVQTLGLGDRVDIQFRDYRDIKGVYDRIVSIEMFEAVGEANWPRYFAGVRDHLADEGVAGLQVITIADRRFDRYRRGADFIQRYVFPGGMLPSPSRLESTIRRAGLHVSQSFAFGSSYAATLAEWGRRFRSAAADVERLGFGERFRRLWEFYLAYCEAGFATGTLDVVQYRVEHA